MWNSARILLLVTAGCFPVFGQAKGSGTPPGTGTTPSPTTTTTTPTLPTTTTPTTPQNTSPPGGRPMYVAGRVIMDDGTPPPTSVSIVRVCSGVSRVMGYTTAKGDFSFDMNHAEATIQDASMPGTTNLSDPTSTRASLDDPMSSMRTNSNSSFSSGGMGNSTVLMGCELRAQLTGYRSSAVQLASGARWMIPRLARSFCIEWARTKAAPSA